MNYCSRHILHNMYQRPALIIRGLKLLYNKWLFTGPTANIGRELAKRALNNVTFDSRDWVAARRIVEEHSDILANQANIGNFNVID